ncbi:hypothetical protein [uncultured Thioclava sp.]|uniref:hypothetical protein n=1 Tax=uncultured Thioclava sp. TaxID=473858 RepID=UPI0025E02D33|nr:hypothetical protein [uncultured Thioclava sp.]
MKIRMKRAADHRISSALSQHFEDGHEYTVPRKTGQALIDQGAAELITQKKEANDG